MTYFNIFSQKSMYMHCGMNKNRYICTSMFKISSKYKPTGDQPEAIRQLVDGVDSGVPAQVLLGVTGSGKTFTVANVIAEVNKPTLILSHNKTLAAQLYEEMKGFFPENAVEYYVSYYDYYQPEAYIPHTDTYIEKDLAINEEIDRFVDMKAAIKEAVKALPKEERIVIEGMYFSHMKAREIMSQLYCSRRTVYRIRDKAIATLESNKKVCHLCQLV